MESKVCVIWSIEKSFDNFYNKNRECKECNIQRSMKRHYGNKGKLTNQRKKFYEKNREALLAKSKFNQQNRNYDRKIFKQ